MQASVDVNLIVTPTQSHTHTDTRDVAMVTVVLASFKRIDLIA